MICSKCGSSSVYWRGKITNLTHTECENCGAINSQIYHDENDENGDDDE